VVAAPRVTPLLTTYLKMPTLQTWIVIVAIFVAAGAVLSALLRLAINEMVGPNISGPDRVAGAALGALRITLLAIMLVVIFDRTIPSGQEPAFLKNSQWRPVLSSAAQRGLRALPPEIEAYIDRLKRYRRQ
jgi:membrane protein required for colicin V production